MKKNNELLWGLILILLGVVLVVGKLGYLPWLTGISLWNLIITVLLACVAARGIAEKNFFVMLMPIALIGCIYSEELGIEAITPWTLIIATALLSIGLGKIFPNKQVEKYIFSHSENGSIGAESSSGTTFDSNVNISNTFGESTRYISGSCVVNVCSSNAFGQTNIYMTNAQIPESGCYVKLDNTFGETNLYLPQNVNVSVRPKKSFGDIKVRTQFASEIVNAPTITVEANSSFGEINIF